jgi:AbrB family looped-hinge helix DNA binding protein
MRVTSKGQVTIPVRIRKKLGLHPDSEVQFEVVGNAARISKVHGSQQRGHRLVNRLRGKATVRMSTEEIMALTRK